MKQRLLSPDFCLLDSHYHPKNLVSCNNFLVFRDRVSTDKALNGLLAVDLSSGFIWGELSDQVNRWIERINTSGITKAIFYLSALEEGERLDLSRIQQEVQKREGVDISVDEIRDVLIKLSRGDLLEYMELGGWFRKVPDIVMMLPDAMDVLPAISD